MKSIILQSYHTESSRERSKEGEDCIQPDQWEYAQCPCERCCELDRIEHVRADFLNGREYDETIYGY